MKQIDLIAITQTLQRYDLFSFNSRTIRDLFDLDKVRASHLLNRMEEKGLVARLEAGKYILLGISPEHVLSNPLFIGCSLISPAYVSFWSALHFYGFTEQVPRRVFLATTHKKRPVFFRGTTYQFITLQPGTFWGYQRQMLGGLPVLVADEARSILDSLLFPRYSGGVGEISKALRNALEQNGATVETQKLIEYTNRLSNRSLASRLGYLLDRLGKPTEGLFGSLGPIYLEPGGNRVGEYNPRWRVYVNVPKELLFPQGVA